MFSMLRLSGAVTMVGIEQIQKAVAAPLDTQAALVRLCDTLDAMADTLIGKLNTPNRTTLDHMSLAQSAVLHNAIDMVDASRAGEFVQKTSEAFAGAMSRAQAGRGVA